MFPPDRSQPESISYTVGNGWSRVGCMCVGGTLSAKHGLSLNTNASFDLPRLLGDLNNKICLSKFLNRLSLLCPNEKKILETCLQGIHINVRSLDKTCRVH